VAHLLDVSGAIGMLLTMCLVSGYRELDAGGRLRHLAGDALVAGTGVGAFVGFASLLGPGVLLLGVVVLAGSPHAVKVCGRWLRSVRAPRRRLNWSPWPVPLPAPVPTLRRCGRPIGDLSDEQPGKAATAVDSQPGWPRAPHAAEDPPAVPDRGRIDAPAVDRDELTWTGVGVDDPLSNGHAH
jgi:hypothetical protein